MATHLEFVCIWQLATKHCKDHCLNNDQFICVVEQDLTKSNTKVCLGKVRPNGIGINDLHDMIPR